MRILGINAIFHDPAAALVVDGQVVAAAEEERFSRRKHGKRPVPFSAWELPEQSAAWCLRHAGIEAADLDAVTYSYDPDLVEPGQAGLDVNWEELRTRYARRAPAFLANAFRGLDPEIVHYVPHHVAHAASAGLAAPFGDCAVMVADGRGECASYLAGEYRDRDLTVLASQRLPDSLGLMYEEVTDHLGFRRSSDEYKVMALASYGKPTMLQTLQELIYADGDGGFVVRPVDWNTLAKRRPAGTELVEEHADLAASVQRCLEQVLLSLVRWLHDRTGNRRLTLAGGVALNCVANTRIADEGPFDELWVQPAAGDAGTALGGALHLAAELGEPAVMTRADLGREWTGDELAAWLDTARLRYERPADVAAVAAEALADDQIVAWFQGRSEYGPRALGRRSLLAHPGRKDNLDRLNAVKGREKFRPVAPMVLADRAGEIFDRGPIPSPYMLFVHDVRPSWRERIPAVVHVDGTARIQTVRRADNPDYHRAIQAFGELTGVPLVLNTSLNVKGEPIVETPQDAVRTLLESKIDYLVLPHLVLSRRGER